MRPSFAFILLVIFFSTVATGRSITVKNECPFTVWPALFTDPHAGGPIPDYSTGWEAPAGTSVTFNVPDTWTAGRIWGRRDCDFSTKARSTKPGPNSCLSGGCNGGLECDKSYGTGVPPVTLAEFTLNAGQNVDYYDISLVDGFNLPMQITNTAGCGVASCPKDLGPDCPEGLQGPTNSSGIPVGCKSDCQVDSNPSNSPSCCTGCHQTAATCPNSGVPNYSFFKMACPNSYVYAYDESSETALWTCSASHSADYTITFCP